jgi:hypothetical protein
MVTAMAKRTIALSLVLSSCASVLRGPCLIQYKTEEVRRLGKADLQCAEIQVTVLTEGEHRLGVSGCGKRAVYADDLRDGKWMLTWRSDVP